MRKVIPVIVYMYLWLRKRAPWWMSIFAQWACKQLHCIKCPCYIHVYDHVSFTWHIMLLMLCTTLCKYSHYYYYYTIMLAYTSPVNYCTNVIGPIWHISSYVTTEWNILPLPLALHRSWLMLTEDTLSPILLTTVLAELPPQAVQSWLLNWEWLLLMKF